MALPSRLQQFLDAGEDSSVSNYPPRLTANGSELTGLSKVITLSPERRRVEALFVHKLSQDWDRAKKEYCKRAKRVYGTDRVVDLDLARLLAGRGVYDTRAQRLANLVPTNGAAGQLTDEYFVDWLAQPVRPNDGDVLILMGVGTSGKTTMARKITAEQPDRYHAIFTRVLSKEDHIISNITRILQSGRKLDLRLMLREPETQFHNRIKEGFKTGATEPLDQFALRYVECLLGFEAAYRHFSQHPNPHVKLDLVINDGAVMKSAGNPLKAIAEIKGKLLGTGPQTGEPTAEDVVKLKKAAIDIAYKQFEAYDRRYLRNLQRGSLRSAIREAIAGDKKRGISQAETTAAVYGITTIAETEKKPLTFRFAQEMAEFFRSLIPSATGIGMSPPQPK